MKSHGNRMRISAIIIALCILSVPFVTHARNQRCTPGALTEQTVKKYPVIIVGKVLKRGDSDEMGSGFALTSWGKNIVHIAKSWKGPARDERIAIHRNERWGDGFSTGGDYLIFAQYDDDDEPNSPLIAPVCSHTRPLDGAGRMVKGLEKYFSRQSQKGAQAAPD